MNSQVTLKLDASSLKLSSCFRRLYWTVAEGWREPVVNNSIAYGLAYHRFQQSLATTGDVDLATCSAIKFFKNCKMDIPSKKEWINITHLANTLNDYREQFGNKVVEDDFVLARAGNEVLVEKNFEIKLHESDDIIIYLDGTLDGIGSFTHGTNAIYDNKVTAAWNQQDYFENYKLNPQLITYAWAMHWFAKNHPGTIWEELCSKRLGTFIRGVFISSSKPTEFKRSDVMFFTEEQLYYYQLHLNWIVARLIGWVKQIKETGSSIAEPEGMFNGSCTQHFGDIKKKCKFFPVCSAPRQDDIQPMLETLFDKVPYNPLNFGGKESE